MDSLIEITLNVLERMEMTLSTCFYLKDIINHASKLHKYVITIYAAVLDNYVYQQWSLYEDVLDSGTMHNTPSVFYITASVGTISRVGRPWFNVGKDQLEYLSSLGFKWTEIAALLS